MSSFQLWGSQRVGVSLIWGSNHNELKTSPNILNTLNKSYLSPLSWILSSSPSPYHFVLYLSPKLGISSLCLILTIESHRSLPALLNSQLRPQSAHHTIYFVGKMSRNKKLSRPPVTITAMYSRIPYQRRNPFCLHSFWESTTDLSLFTLEQ